jgi:hypothetical protein
MTAVGAFMKRLFGLVTIILCLATAAPQTANALYRTSKFGDIDLGGRLRTINIVRHPNIETYAFIMQRNELKLRFEWKWLQRGKAVGKYKIPWLSRSDIFLTYRGIYDSVYDLAPHQIEREDFQGDPISSDLAQINSIPKGERDNLKFNNRLRDAYIDLYFKNIPLTIRAGKQQVVWGESDGFRMLDRANTLDLSWHFFQELPPPGFGFDEVRQPFWMIKGLWDFKQLGPLSQPFLEIYWNPGDWNPGKIAFLPRPWGIKLLDPIKNARGDGFLQVLDCTRNSQGECDNLMNGTELFKQGTWSRNPLENSQFGMRFHFITPGGYEWTLNYLYQRMSPDGSPVAIVRGVPADKTFHVQDSIGIIPGDQPGDLTAAQYCEGLTADPGSIRAPWGQREPCIEYFAPYIHTVGASLNFFEGNWTQTVWRLETIIDFDLPFYDGDKQTALFGRAPNGPTLLPGITHKNMWKGMLAFDRPTWIRWLNKKTTFFVTGQLFWHYIINHERRRCAIDDDPANGYTSGLSENCGSDTELLLPGEQVGLIGPFDLPKLTAPAGRGRDTIHQWESLFTLAVLGFYKGGSLVPAMIYLLDPINSYAQEFAFGIDWFVTPDVAVNFSTRIMWVGAPWDTYGRPGDDINDGLNFEPWTFGGISKGRSESGIMLTWQF